MAVLMQALPKLGKLEVDIRVTADVNVSAFSARQKVNAFVLSDISYMMHVGDPTLVLAAAFGGGCRSCCRRPPAATAAGIALRQALRGLRDVSRGFPIPGLGAWPPIQS